MVKIRKLVVFDAIGVIYFFPEGNDVEYGVFSFLRDKGYNFTDAEKICWEKTGGYNQVTRGQISSLEALQIIIPSAGTRVLQRLEKEYLSSTYFCLADDFISTVELLKDDFFGCNVMLMTSPIGQVRY